VIYDPIHNDLFAAEKNKGAAVNNRRLAVSSRDNLENAMLVTGNHRFSPEAERQAAFVLFDAVSQCGAALRFFGATALDLAYLAAGRSDACLYHSVKPWDIAAGLLLVREAGGVVAEPGGAPAHACSPALLASNQSLHAPLQKLLAGKK
ncbi:MAG: inositol monophosphatase, partial [Pseudomonadota bacterium]|nr:inositol monophosphatase [Pseudomonadota bacterium]